MNSSKKLLYIANLRLPTEKAYGIQIVKMCEAFSELGLGVELVAPYRISKIKDDLFDYYGVRNIFIFKRIFSPDLYLPSKMNIIALGFKNLISALILSVYALIRRPDMVFSRDELPLFFLSFFRDRLVYEAHRFSNSRKIFYKRFINKKVKVVVITSQLKEDFLKLGFGLENILVAPDGVDLEKFNTEISQEEARLKIGLPLSKKIVVYNGHLFEWKGVYTLLETARLCPNVLFVFVGGTLRDIEVFKKKAESMENVMILGHRPYKEMPIFLRSADVLVLPNSAKEEISRSYTSPLKLFEYM
ncbi:MAG: glycosyltransferase, partial [bacterium]|nr:glycosyltransferase [bacterium]